MTQYDKIIYSLAHRYAQDAAEFEDLVSEGRIAALLAERDYDESKGTKKSTVVWRYANNAMIDYVRKLQRAPRVLEETPDMSGGERPDQLDWMHDLSQEAQLVAKIIFEAPEEFLQFASGTAKGIGWQQFCRVFAPKTKLTWAALQRVYREFRRALS